jgi:hypothetical protein
MVPSVASRPGLLVAAWWRVTTPPSGTTRGQDARFLGTPIDFLVFDGMSDAVLEGWVSWKEFRIGGA